MSSDDDIPGLESVSGSDYVEDDSEEDSEDEALGVPQGTNIEPNSAFWSRFYDSAEMWYKVVNASMRSQHVEVVRVYVLSPFLYGHAHQSDRWLKWCHEVGLLQSDIEFNLETLSEKELLTIDILLRALKYVGSSLMQNGEVDNLAQLLRLADEIDPLDGPAKAARHARKCSKWFMILIEDFQKSVDKVGGVPRNTLYDKSNSVEIGCLYVINQVSEHVMKLLSKKADYHSDFRKQLQSHEENGELMKAEGEAHEKKGNFDEAIDTYSTAIICCPYYHQLYINRAYAHMEKQNFRASIADGLRAVNLKPRDSKGHVCYIQALKAAGATERVNLAVEDYNKRFPKERESLKRSLEQLRGLDKRIRVPTEKEEVLNEKLLATCKQASEACLTGSLDEALFYYQEAVATSEEDKAWQICWEFSDCEKFLVSLHFAYGMALMKKGTRKDVQKALEQFNSIITDYQFSTFPPAYYGVAKSLSLLHCYSEALDNIKKGLDLLSSYRVIALNWPGTDVGIVECLSHDIENKLQQLQQFCEPVQVPDMICRYAGCLQHHTSCIIILNSSDYKGHVQVQCVEGCGICYHPACWRKFKSDCVISTDRDFLGSTCTTPDCGGIIKTVSVHDTGGLKIKLEAEPSVLKTTPNAPPVSLSLAPAAKDGKRSNHTKHGKKKSIPDTPDNLSKVSTPEKVEHKPDPVELSSNIEEDFRKVEDSLAIINKRQVETEGEEQEISIVGKGGKIKKKPKAKSNSEHWNDLFILPEREGLVTGEDSSIYKWEPDPDAPFQPPEHMRDVIDDFEMSEVPNIGLVPRPVGTAPPTNNEETASPPKPEVIDDLEFIQSYFGEIVRTHGPLDPTDPKIVDPLSFLPMDKREMIVKAGGISKLLLKSGKFTTEGRLLCSIEEKKVIAESLSSYSLSKKKSSEDGVNIKQHHQNKGVKDRKKPTSQLDGSNSRKSGTLPGGPSANKSSLSGLLSASSSSSIEDSSSGGKGQSRHTTNGSGSGSGLVDIIKSQKHKDFVDMGWSSTSTKTPLDSSKVPRKEKNNSEPLSLEKRSESRDKGKRYSYKDGRDEVVGVTGGTNGHSSVAEPKHRVREKIKELGTGKRSSSKVGSSQNSSGSEGFVEASSINDLEKRNTFSPTNSTSSVSSGSSSTTSSSTAALELPTPTKKSKSKKTKKIPSDKPEYTGKLPSVSHVQFISAMIQTDTPLLKDKWVMTDVLPPVESFKDRYDCAIKEKKDLQEKLERSEDQKFKLQKAHKRETEELLKQNKLQVKQEVESKMIEMEGKLKIETSRMEGIKKEHSEQLRATKAEIKSLIEKIERMKKDSSKKELQNENRTRQLRGEIEQLQDERHKCNESLKLQKETEIQAVIRATNAEVEVLSMRRDLIIKPWEQRLREVEALCLTIPQASDLYRECAGYKDKLRGALNTYQNAMEDQIRMVKTGHNLAGLDRIPSPMVPIPQQLMMMMRPGFYHPMMSIPRPPFMGGMVDPSMMRPRFPMGPGSMPISMPEPETNSMSNLPDALVRDAMEPSASSSDLDMLNGGTGGKKSSFDRIVEKLEAMYPHYARDDFKGLLREVRRNNKNTLSGLSLDTITQQVKGIIEQQEKKGSGRGLRSVSGGKGRHVEKKEKGKKSRLPPVAVAPPPIQSSMVYDNEGSCIICYEDMGDRDSSQLNCGHRFHSKCIRSWFKEQSTCPTCRNHSLLTDEYPSLK